MGPQSIDKVDLLLNNIGYKSSAESITAQFKSKTNPCAYDNNLTFQVNLTGCNYQNRLILSPSKAITQYIRQDYQPIVSNNFTNTFHPIQHDLFWKQAFGQSPQLAKYQFSTRSKYTHKRKDKISKEQKQKMIKQNPLAITTPKKEKNKMVEEKQQIIYQIKQPIKQRSIPQRRLLISLINKNKDTDGCLLMFSNFDFSYIWRKLTFLNCKVIGLHQYQTILNQNQQRVYPRDYPQTQGYHKWFEGQINESVIKYRRKPTAKVAHYKQLCSPFPFGISIPLFNLYYRQQITFKNVKCVSVGRGSIPSYSYICYPLKQDIDKLKQLINSNEGISHVHKQQLIQTQRLQRKQLLKLTNTELIEYFMETKMDRQIIGFITSGNINFKMSKGYGLGVINQHYTLPYVLVRKPTSPYYFLAEIYY